MDYKNIPNYFNFESFYDFIVNRFSKGIFVEIGTWFGASTVYLASQIKKNNKDIKIHAVDNFTANGSGPILEGIVKENGGNFYNIFLNNLKDHHVDDIVNVIQGDSTDSSSLFDSASLDFVYIDANHQYDKVNSDIEAWKTKIKPGGIISGHDYDKSHWGVTKAVNEHFRSRFKLIGNSWYVEM